MQIETGKFYILNNGDLMRTFIEDGIGCMIGAIWEPEDDGEPGYWDAYVWRLNGKFGRNADRSASLDVCEEINARPSMVSYAKRFDYCATYENDEPDDNGNMRQGFGATEIEAVMDLLQAYPGEERAERMREAA